MASRDFRYRISGTMKPRKKELAAAAAKLEETQY